MQLRFLFTVLASVLPLSGSASGRARTDIFLCETSHDFYLNHDLVQLQATDLNFHWKQKALPSLTKADLTRGFLFSFSVSSTACA